jgi:hypothetical protein
MTTSMIANASDWNAVVFAMIAYSTNDCSSTRLPPHLAKGCAGHVDGSHDIFNV